MRPVKLCVDPIFFGSAVYALVSGKLCKLSKVQQVTVSCYQVWITTLNTSYKADFSNLRTREYFLENCTEKNLYNLRITKGLENE